MKSTHVIGSLLDTKAGIFSPPHLFRTKADFIRSIQTEAKNPQSMLHQHPGDYDLYIVGDWHESTAIDVTERIETPERLGSVLDLCPLN